MRIFRSREDRRSAFSLVEVTLAMGIVSFCLLAILGLLPVGLQSAKASREHAAAAACAEQIAVAIASAKPNGSGNFEAAGVLDGVTWNLGGSEVTLPPLRDISLGGVATDEEIERRLVAHVAISPPGSPGGGGGPTGSALISVAWPNRAEWDDASKSWSNENGSVASRIIFLPVQ